MLINVYEVYRKGTNYSAPHEYGRRELLLNTDHIIKITDNNDITGRLNEGQIVGIGDKSYCNVVVGSGNFTNEINSITNGIN